MKKVAALSAVFGILLITVPFVTHAQTGQPIGITVSPVIDDISINPGQTINRQIKITNPTNTRLTLYPVTLNFTTDNNEGKPVFYSDSEKSSKYSLSSWIKPNTGDITVEPLQFTTLGYTITAPADAEPGGHYGAILLSTQKPEPSSTGTQVSVVGLIGTLLLATVPGNVTYAGAVSSFDAPTFLATPPANFTTTVTNTGNTHFRPIGDIKIRNWSGAVVADLTVNDTQGAVLPDSQRKFTNTWQFDWKTFGRYTATVTLAYGSPEQTMTEMRVFYVFPYWSLIVLGLLLLLLIIWLIRRQRPPRAIAPKPTPPQPQPRPSRIVMR